MSRSTQGSAMDSQCTELRCLLTEPGLQKRQGELLRDLDAIAHSRHWGRDHVTFTFDAAPASLATALDLVRLERECCPFLRFVIDVQPFGTMLIISGPMGTGPFLRELGFGPVA